MIRTVDSNRDERLPQAPKKSLELLQSNLGGLWARGCCNSAAQAEFVALSDPARVCPYRSDRGIDHRNACQKAHKIFVCSLSRSDSMVPNSPMTFNPS